ncbi:hypothetical protein GQX73_g8148 [Xylaria multiplex]|uniref:DUF2293 domain-containing protein n=1 Tax=Xylaria multiplex TaxID=323545 RepID=A0A7C8IJT1_9PEZI|nr:hypothetical protein GQX73_g8148 [Xylaria multiplex]
MERASQYSDSVWRNLNPLKAPPKMKHKSYFEAVENADKKKKKLEFEITTDREPPPGFEFIPTGHPELSQECKEQSRDRDAMFFIVSNSKDTLKLDHHMNRLGYHFRHSIVEEARKILTKKGHHDQAAYVHEPGKPEPIPNSQREIDLEADAVLRDLFPRIPHTDRQEIIDHAFKKDGKFNGEIKVGMAKDITLARRVQLAALAHIRHTHTRYDQLLKESDWANARKAVEKPCLDIIVKWRGDEETGRDQLDEILREVIEISDTEIDSEDEGSSADNARVRIPQTRSVAASIPSRAVSRLSRPPNRHVGVDSQTSSPALASPRTPSGVRKLTKVDKRTARKTQQRFKRYAAAAEALANSSNQNGHPESPSTPGFVATPIEVRHQGSAHPVNTYRTAPSTVVHETYIPRVPYGHTEIQRIPISHSDGVSQGGMTHAPGSTEQFIRVPDAQRPKVGPYSANYSQPPPPSLSPVRLGLQDMLLPSIEPRSPVGARALQDVSQRVHSDAQQVTEFPRVISRTIVEPVVPSARPRSPGAMVTDQGITKRPRVTTYFPEDFEGPSSSYVRVAPRNQQDVSRQPQFEYLTDRQPLASRGPERIVYQDTPWVPLGQEVRVIRHEDDYHRSRGHPIPVTGDDRPPIPSGAPDRTMYQSSLRALPRQEYPVNRIEAPLRSRANPIVIDGDTRYEPRRVIEVRAPPAHEIYRTTSPRGNGRPSPHIQGDPRVRDAPRVVYLDDSSRLRSEPDNRRAVPQFQPGPPIYEEPPRLLSPPNVSRQPQHQHQPNTFERPTRYAAPHDREVPRAIDPGRTSLAWPGTTSREIQAPLQEAPRERLVGPQQHPGVRTAQQPRDGAIYVGSERQPQQPFPVYPAPSSYTEIRGPLSHQRMPDQRDMIYVE